MTNESAGRLDERVVKFGNVLVSSAARKLPLLKSLKDAARKVHPDIRVIAADLNPDAPAGLISDDFMMMPDTRDGNLKDLLELCREKKVGLVVPTRDGELGFWAQNAEAFRKQGTNVLISQPDAISQCVDKLAFSEHGERRGLPIISAYEKKQGNGPFVVKERYGAGSRSIGLNLNAEDAEAHASTLEHPIFQPYIDGTEISVDAWFDRQCRVKGLVLRYRNTVVNGESQVTTTFRNADLEQICSDVLETLKLRGPIVMQLLIDPKGQPHIIEVNARFGGASTASIAAGLDGWYWALLENAGANLDEYPFVRSAEEVRQVRVPSDIVLYDSDF